MTSIFPGVLNNIDFLRRYDGWSSRWVVGDIEATIDITAANNFLDGRRGWLPLLHWVGVPARGQMLMGRDLAAAVNKP
jgi:hypothetical protein